MIVALTSSCLIGIFQVEEHEAGLEPSGTVDSEPVLDTENVEQGSGSVTNHPDQVSRDHNQVLLKDTNDVHPLSRVSATNDWRSKLPPHYRRTGSYCAMQDNAIALQQSTLTLSDKVRANDACFGCPSGSTGR